MGLNDDVLDDLDPAFDPTKELQNDLVVPPQDAVASDEVNIITPMNAPVDVEVSDQDLFENPVPGELPDLKATITLVKDNGNKLIDLKDIEAVVLAQECISLESANMIEDYFGNFYTRELAKNSFTHYPTQTNYRYSIKFMRDRISAEEANLDKDIKACLKQAKTTISAKCKLIKDKDIVDAQTFIRSFSTTYEQNILAIVNSKDLVIPVGAQFINLLNEPITKLALANADWSRAKLNPTTLIDAIAALQSHLANPALVKFFNWVIADNSEQNQLGCAYYDVNDAERLASFITLAGLLDSYIHGNYNKALDIFTTKLLQIEDLINSFASDPEISKKFNDFASSTEKAIDDLSYINDITSRLVYVNNAVKTVVDSLSIE